MPTNHISIQDNTTTLPQPVGGDRDFQKNFDAPGVNGRNRPFLAYQVDPFGTTNVRLEIDLNGTPIVGETFNSGQDRSLNAIFDVGVLQETGNILTVTVPNTEPGTLEIRSLIMFYSADA